MSDYDEMSDEELAKLFSAPIPVKPKTPDVDKMTIDQIEEWEEEEKNSNDIYRIAARVKNLAREDGASLTPVGEILCNSFIHVIKDLYDLADTLDVDTREKLRYNIRKHENMPAKVIAAAKTGVKKK